jgi:hypothetical protein
MFLRVINENWTICVSVFAFAVTLAVFVTTTVRALRLPRGERDRLSSLPLTTSKTEPHPGDES